MPNPNEIPEAPIYFLGVCDRFNEPVIYASSEYEYRRTDLIGLRHYFFSPIFPFPADSFFLVFALDNAFVVEQSEIKMVIKNVSRAQEIGQINVTAGLEGPGSGFASRFTLGAGRLPGTYTEPGNYQVLWERPDKQQVVIGEFQLAFRPTIGLTPERIQALKSDPNAAKYVRISLGCTKCETFVKAWVGIDGKDKKDEDGYIWYENIPDHFKCSCGKVDYSLKYIKGGLHGLLGVKQSPFSVGVEIERNYTRAALEEILRDFAKVVESAQNEQEIQGFIEKNKIVLSCFSPELLKFKAPATAKFETDFTLLNQKGELILIEIEKANTPLFTKLGVQHSKLTQAIGQVEDWLKEARRNKLGLIDDLSMEGLKFDMVNAVKGVVIAGRSKKEYEPFIEKLYTRPDISFYTYDDLIRAFRHIVQSVEGV